MVAPLAQPVAAETNDLFDLYLEWQEGFFGGCSVPSDHLHSGCGTGHTVMAQQHQKTRPMVEEALRLPVGIEVVGIPVAVVDGDDPIWHGLEIRMDVLERRSVDAWEGALEDALQNVPGDAPRDATLEDICQAAAARFGSWGLGVDMAQTKGDNPGVGVDDPSEEDGSLDRFLAAPSAHLWDLVDHVHQAHDHMEVGFEVIHDVLARVEAGDVGRTRLLNRLVLALHVLAAPFPLHLAFLVLPYSDRRRDTLSY